MGNPARWLKEYINTAVSCKALNTVICNAIVMQEMLPFTAKDDISSEEDNNCLRT